MFSQQQGDPDAQPRADAALALYVQDEISVRRNLAVTMGVPLRLAEFLRGPQQPRSAALVRVGPWQEGRDRGARRRRPLQRAAERRNDGRRDQVARRAGVPLRPPRSRLPDPTGSGSSIDDQPTSLVQLRCLRSSFRTRSSSALGIDRQVWKGDDPVGQLHRVARVPPDALARYQCAAAAVLRRAARSGPRRRSGRSSRRPASGAAPCRWCFAASCCRGSAGRCSTCSGGRSTTRTASGRYPANNYDLTGEWGRASFDERHRFDLVGSINAGRWFTLGVAFSAGRADPTRCGSAATSTTTAPPMHVRQACLRNSLQATGSANLDLRWSHTFALTKAEDEDEGVKINVGVDAFNVLNRVNFTGCVGDLRSPVLRPGHIRPGGAPLPAHRAVRVLDGTPAPAPSCTPPPPVCGILSRVRARRTPGRGRRPASASSALIEGRPCRPLIDDDSSRARRPRPPDS